MQQPSPPPLTVFIAPLWVGPSPLPPCLPASSLSSQFHLSASTSFLYSFTPPLTLQPSVIIYCAILSISVRIIVLPLTPVSSPCISINSIFHRCLKSAWCWVLALFLLFCVDVCVAECSAALSLCHSTGPLNRSRWKGSWSCKNSVKS